MNEKVLVVKGSFPESSIHLKRRELQIRRKRELAQVNYKRLVKKANKENRQPLKSHDQPSLNHGIFFTVCLGVSSIVFPQLAGLSIIFAILILGKTLAENLEQFKFQKVQKTNTYKGPRIVRENKVKLPKHIVKSEKPLPFTDENGVTITQFNWRHIS